MWMTVDRYVSQETIARTIAQSALKYAYGPNIPRGSIEVENNFLRARPQWMAAADAVIELLETA
jgi:hypothetical protein